MNMPWMIFASLIAAFLCSTLLTTTLADETVAAVADTQEAVTEEGTNSGADLAETWSELSEERKTYCMNLLDDTVYCPHDRYPLVSSIQKSYEWTGGDAEKLKTLFDASIQLGVGKSCEEYNGYRECLGNMSDTVLKECFHYQGRYLVHAAEFMINIAKPLFQAGVEMCTDDNLNLLSEHFSCLYNLDHLTKIAYCAVNNPEETDAVKCMDDEINNAEDCKEGAEDLIKVFLASLNEKTKDADEMEARLEFLKYLTDSLYPESTSS